MIKIGILNDTHLGLTTAEELKECFKTLALRKPDMIIHAGDYNGGEDGNFAVRKTCQLLRRTFRYIPIFSVVGNHDLWQPEPSLENFFLNYDLVCKAFKASHITFLDEEVHFLDDITIVGESGWYHVLPLSNDWNFIPKHIEGDTHAYLNQLSHKRLEEKLKEIGEKRPNEKRIFVSHFPVIDCMPWDGNPKIGKMLKDQFGFDYFISGHSHFEKNGPIHYRTNSDYGRPHSKVIEIGGERK